MKRKEKKPASIEKEPSMEEILGKLNDEELFKVLQYRDSYRPEAAQFAIVEAVQRGIINSIENLPPLKNSEKKKFLLFPVIEQPHIRYKIKKSLIRTLIFVGLLPVLWGVAKLNEGLRTDGIAVLIFGLLWEGASLLLLLNKQNLIARIVLIVLTITSTGYIIPLAFREPRFNLLDWIITGTIYLLIIYSQIFIYRITTKETSA